MKGINYQVAFGTILVFAAFYCFKALLQKDVPAHGSGSGTPKGKSISNKFVLAIAGIATAAGGVFLIIKAIKQI